MNIEAIETQRYRFWITGARQYSEETFIDFAVDTAGDMIEPWLEEWVHSLQHSSEMVNFGYEPIGKPFTKHLISISEMDFRSLLKVPVTDQVYSVHVYEDEVLITTLPVYMSREEDDKGE